MAKTGTDAKGGSTTTLDTVTIVGTRRSVASAIDRKRRADNESLRLLYVALTRARCWLIVAGAGEAKTTRKDGKDRQTGEQIPAAEAVSVETPAPLGEPAAVAPEEPAPAQARRSKPAHPREPPSVQSALTPRARPIATAARVSICRVSIWASRRGRCRWPP